MLDVPPPEVDAKLLHLHLIEPQSGLPSGQHLPLSDFAEGRVSVEAHGIERIAREAVPVQERCGERAVVDDLKDGADIQHHSTNGHPPSLPAMPAD